MNSVLDIIGAVFLLLGAMLCFAASVGLVIADNDLAEHGTTV